ncbi:TetR family transcriptional regulator [Stenotrophomonas rhizophila]|uniref:TetR family transcriptional regulator n=1 Tax=Stenotrophomonas rhizophila TaxID=216778 RepID=A0A498CGQ1_9GAMM|nr:TetR/AcrR family transcriptional regulator [Stenotrophomonas rhizophila]RLK56391.1 TetR family transcriptional regulator [Stenotrophomonas rhizophila]
MASTLQGKPAPGRPLDVTRENALLDAALEILGEVGFERLTILAVCERAGASTKTAYRRWAHKEELLAACLRRAVLREVETVRPVQESDCLRDELVEILSEQFTSFRANPNLVVGLIVASRLSHELGEISKGMVQHHETAYADRLIRGARARGEISATPDPARVASLIRGYFLHEVLVTSSRPSETQIISFVDDVLMPFILR